MTKAADQFARATAAKAHKRATEALAEAVDARQLVRELAGENRIVGRCRLCGEPARRDYCHEHEWAA